MAKGKRAFLKPAAGLLALAVLAVLIVVGASGGGGNDKKPRGAGSDPSRDRTSAPPPHVEGARQVSRMLRGIPQYGLILGSEDAPIELIEYGDLQCAVCRRYAEKILPPIIRGPVRRGRVVISFRNFVLAGEQSAEAGAAALAAGEESVGWNYLELFYRNQGAEGSGYAEEAFLRAIARASGVKHMDAWAKRRELSAFEPDLTTKQARHFGFTNTPAFMIRGPGAHGAKVLRNPRTTEDFEAAIEAAAG